MKKFEFSPSKPKAHIISPFSGRTFYYVYKDSDFLRSQENIEKVLCKGHELRQSLKEVSPGKSIVVGGMWIQKGVPLLLKNTHGANVVVNEHEFTYSRLTGLIAAYVYDNRHRFSKMAASEPDSLGLTWDNQDENASKLYLSAISGSEHFPQFSFYPLVCALRKLQLKKITLPPVVKIAKIKDDNGECMATTLMKNLILTKQLWKSFGGPLSDINLMELLSIVPPELENLLLGKNK